MISEGYAHSQVMRMSGMKYFPREGGGVGELVLAAASADTELNCWIAISEFTESEQECPTPADVRRTIQRLKKPVERKTCETCGGTGFMLVRRKYAGDREDLK